jgi:pimeloyl-ACP methyl ester carboxylesterase
VSTTEHQDPLEALLNRPVDEAGRVWVLGRPTGPRLPATPSNGPDPYGDASREWLEIDWTEHCRMEDVGGAAINLVEMGEGPAVLLVHGLSGCWQNWLANIPHLARSHRGIALDLPGFGSSPMPPWEISIRGYSDLLRDLCGQLDTGPVFLVGSSMGGFISADVAAATPELVRKLVLVAAAGISHARMRRAPAETAARMARAMAPFAFRYREHALRRPGMRQIALRNIFYNPNALPAQFLWEVVHKGIQGPGFVDAIRGLAGYDMLDKLEEVEVETLIVWGRNDRIVPPADALGYLRRLRNARLEVFDRCGHLPMGERPVRFNRILDEFFDAEP